MVRLVRLKLEEIWLDMRVCRQSHGRVQLWDTGGEGGGWRKGGSKRSNSTSEHARNAARPESRAYEVSVNCCLAA
jgi:hypothetical protein